GRPLVLLASLWLAGRVAMACAGVLPFAVVAVAELAFMPALAATIAPSLLRTSNRNAPLLLVLFVFWAVDGAFLYALRDGDFLVASRALRLALDLVLVLVTVIG